MQTTGTTTSAYINRHRKPMRETAGTATDDERGRQQTATFIHHMVATDKQRAVQYMINKNTFNNAYDIRPSHGSD